MSDDVDDSGKNDDEPARHLRVIPGGTTPDDVERELPKRLLSDLVGVATVKRALRSIIDDASEGNHPGHRWTGTFLYGPPSCGKTFATEVVAGELHASHWHVDLSKSWEQEHFITVLSHASQDAKQRKTVLFLNHLDNDNAHATMLRNVDALNEFGEQPNTLVFGSATYPWQVDSAIVRSDRLGRALLVLPPDEPSRRTFLETRLRNRAQALKEDLDWVVGRTDGYSFADLEALVDVALRETSGDTIDRSAWRMGRRDVPPSCAEWLSRAGHHAMISASGGIYDDLITYFNMRQKG